MNENIVLLLKKVEADPELQKKFENIKDPDEAFALASSVQEGFTKEEFIDEMTRIKNAMDENLSDEDLAKSAGGVDRQDVTVSILFATAVSGGAAVGAAI